ncbi:MAG TPA: bacteriophage holin [Candidatus Paceibacterota bacterium]|nr:bacteriophage holin [Candidatus Paceibacterota bacterium]
MKKINTKALAVSGGLIWGVLMFLTTLLSITTGYGTEMLEIFKSIYPGYSITLVGSVVGFVYGFFDLFIAFGIFGWLYNKLK